MNNDGKRIKPYSPPDPKLNGARKLWKKYDKKMKKIIDVATLSKLIEDVAIFQTTFSWSRGVKF